MIALWLAQAAGATESLQQRLLDPLPEETTPAQPAAGEVAVTPSTAASETTGDQAGTSTTGTTETSTTQAADSQWALAGDVLTGLWPFGLAAGGAGLLLFARRRTGRGLELTVVSRTAVSTQSSLLLVDVRDPLGREHRLLVGIGGGPPALIADLGTADEPEGDLSAEVEIPPETSYAGHRASAQVRPVHLNRELLESPTLPNLTDAHRTGRKADAQSLISEIVEERRTAMVRP